MNCVYFPKNKIFSLVFNVILLGSKLRFILRIKLGFAILMLQSEFTKLKNCVEDIEINFIVV